MGLVDGTGVGANWYVRTAGFLFADRFILGLTFSESIACGSTCGDYKAAGQYQVRLRANRGLGTIAILHRSLETNPREPYAGSGRLGTEVMSNTPIQETKDRVNSAWPGNHAANNAPTAESWYSSPRAAANSFLSWVRESRPAPSKKAQPMDWRASAFILLQVLLGLPFILYAVLHLHPDDTLRFACFFALAMAASIFKVRLPGIEATMSANFIFILLGILEFSFPETLLIGCMGGLAQSIWQSKTRPSRIQMLFNFSNLSLSISLASFVFHSSFAYQHGLRWPLLLGAASTTYFLVNSMSVSGIIAITQKRKPLAVWKECFLWSFPYYLLGGVIAAGMSYMNRVLGWQLAILILPIVYWIYRSYRVYLDRLEAEKTHSTEIADLHLRTIEALSLAIEAKDQNTHAHLNLSLIHI